MSHLKTTSIWQCDICEKSVEQNNAEKPRYWSQVTLAYKDSDILRPVQCHFLLACSTCLGRSDQKDWQERFLSSVKKVFHKSEIS